MTVDAQGEELLKSDRGEPESLRLTGTRVERNGKGKGRRTVTLSRAQPQFGICIDKLPVGGTELTRWAHAKAGEDAAQGIRISFRELQSRMNKKWSVRLSGHYYFNACREAINLFEERYEALDVEVYTGWRWSAKGWHRYSEADNAAGRADEF